MGSSNNIQVTDTTNDDIIQLSDVVQHEGKSSNVCGAFPTLMRSVIETVKDLKSSQAITAKDMGVIVPQLIQSTLQASIEYTLEVNKRNKELELLTLDVSMKQLELSNYQARIDTELEILQAQRDREVFSVTNMLPLEKSKLAYQVNTLLPAEKAQIDANVELLGANKANAIKEGSLIDSRTANTTADTAVKGTENSIKQYELASLLPKQLEKLTADIARTAIDTDIKQYELTSLLPQELTKMSAEAQLSIANKNIAEFEVTSMLPAKLTSITSDNNLKDSQKQLTDAKTLTEAQNTLATSKQATLYENQALAFSYKHRKEVADMLINAYLMASSQSTSLASTSSAFGTTLASTIQSAIWA